MDKRTYPLARGALALLFIPVFVAIVLIAFSPNSDSLNDLKPLILGIAISIAALIVVIYVCLSKSLLFGVVLAWGLFGLLLITGLIGIVSGPDLETSAMHRMGSMGSSVLFLVGGSIGVLGMSFNRQEKTNADSQSKRPSSKKSSGDPNAPW